MQSVSLCNDDDNNIFNNDDNDNVNNNCAVDHNFDDNSNFVANDSNNNVIVHNNTTNNHFFHNFIVDYATRRHNNHKLDHLHLVWFGKLDCNDIVFISRWNESFTSNCFNVGIEHDDEPRQQLVGASFNDQRGWFFRCTG
jgi:SPX domain protein involved in polyphosphate accumulation